MKSWKKYAALFMLFCLIGYPLLYYAYKNGTPEFGGLDVKSYYKLYTNWDFAHVDSPFNQRILSSFAIFMLHKSGIHYSTETAIQAMHYDPQVYFCALLFNFLCVIGTCIVIYRTVEKHLQASPVFSFAAGLLFLLGFGTLTFLISALSDALSVLLLAIIFKFFLEKNWLAQIPFLLMAIFQREYIFFVFGLMAAMYWIREKENRRYYFIVGALNVACFLGYFICRKTIFFSPRYEHQIEAGAFLSNLANSVEDAGAFIRQTFLIQNLFFLFVGIYLYKKWKKLDASGFHLLVLLAVLAETVAISLLVRLGNNTGRYYYMTAPIVIFYVALELVPLLRGAKAIDRA